MFWKVLSKRLWITALLLIAVLSVAFYIALGRGAKENTTSQVLHQQQILARAESANLSSFFQSFGDAVAQRARISGSEDINTLRRNSDLFVMQWAPGGLVAGIVVTNSKGTVIVNSNTLGTHDLGKAVADRDYFSWAKGAKEGEYFVGQPVIGRIGAGQGQTIIPVASPTFSNGKFTGVIVSAVLLQPLTQKYLGLLKISNSTDIYLVDSDGTFLFSTQDALPAGANIFEYLKNHSYSGSQGVAEQIRSNLMSSREGNMILPINILTGEKTMRLIGYAPVNLVNQHWVVVMISPDTNVVDMTRPIYIRQIAILLLASFTIILFGYIVARNQNKL